MATSSFRRGYFRHAASISSPVAALLGCTVTALLFLYIRLLPRGFIPQRPLSWSGPAPTLLPPVPQGMQRPAPTFVFALVTAAFIPGRFGDQRQYLRNKEYTLGLDFFFPRFGNRVAGLIAGTNDAQSWPILLRYDFSMLEFFDSKTFSTQSAKESQGIQHFVQKISRPDGGGDMASTWYSITDDDVVLKASGRYQIVRDDFLDEIALTREFFDVWAKPFGSWILDEEGQHKITKGEKKVFTFCWAMKWRYFKDLYLHVDLDKLEHFDGNKGWFVITNILR